MNNFFSNIKELLDEIPAKTKFLKDLDLNNSYTGFRYFMQGKKQEPSVKFMKKLCDETGYEYILLPVKPTEEHQIMKEKLQTEFRADLKDYLKKYEGDSARTYTKNFGTESSISNAVVAFENEEDLLDPDKQLDVSELF